MKTPTKVARPRLVRCIAQRRHRRLSLGLKRWSSFCPVSQDSALTFAFIQRLAGGKYYE